jgi:hypothetical protein
MRVEIMKKEALIKHHFWILLGVAPVLTLLAFLLMWLFVNGAVSEQKKAYAASLAGLKVDVKTKGELQAKENSKEVLTKQKDELWSANFTRQDAAKVFDWPSGGNTALQAHSDKKYKFGSLFVASGRELTQDVIKTAFDKGYEKLDEQIEPTRFAGGTWRSALRYVSNWGNKPLESRVLWLALEDYWAQKALLQPIADLNAAASKFANITPKEANNPLKRTFQNRVWEVELEVYEQGNKKMMKGVLKNRTDRLQVIGMNKSMRLNIWLDDAKNSQADFAFLIQGDNVPGQGKLVCEPRALTSVPQVNGIVRVEQVFDAATAPVRLVNTVALGMLDHKNRAATLEVPKHLEEEGGDAAPATPDGGGTPDGMPGGPPGGRPGMGGTAATGGAKTGGPEAVLLGNKKRYLKRTEDVRRMPVALSMVIDRDFVNDLLIIYSNSVLRFQVTQTQWQRYRGSLPAIGGSSSMTTGSTSMPGGPEGMPGGPPSGIGGRPGGMPGGPPGGRPGISGGGGSSPGGTEGGEGNATSNPGAASSSSDEDTVPAEANAGLVEFAVYGVISLYEKKLAAKPGEVAPGAEQPVAPAAPAVPMGDKPAPAAPATPAPAAPATPAPAAVPMGDKPAAPPATPPGNPPAAPPTQQPK